MSSSKEEAAKVAAAAAAAEILGLDSELNSTTSVAPELNILSKKVLELDLQLLKLSKDLMSSEDLKLHPEEESKVYVVAENAQQQLPTIDARLTEIEKNQISQNEMIVVMISAIGLLTETSKTIEETVGNIDETTTQTSKDVVNIQKTQQAQQPNVVASVASQIFKLSTMLLSMLKRSLNIINTYKPSSWLTGSGPIITILRLIALFTELNIFLSLLKLLIELAGYSGDALLEKSALVMADIVIVLYETVFNLLTTTGSPVFKMLKAFGKGLIRNPTLKAHYDLIVNKLIEYVIAFKRLVMHSTGLGDAIEFINANKGLMGAAAKVGDTAVEKMHELKDTAIDAIGNAASNLGGNVLKLALTSLATLTTNRYIAGTTTGALAPGAGSYIGFTPNTGALFAGSLYPEIISGEETRLLLESLPTTNFVIPTNLSDSSDLEFSDIRVIEPPALLDIAMVDEAVLVFDAFEIQLDSYYNVVETVITELDPSVKFNYGYEITDMKKEGGGNKSLETVCKNLQNILGTILLNTDLIRHFMFVCETGLKLYIGDLTQQGKEAKEANKGGKRKSRSRKYLRHKTHKRIRHKLYKNKNKNKKCSKRRYKIRRHSKRRNKK